MAGMDVAIGATGMATCGITRMEGGRTLGMSNPFSLRFISLQAMENSFKSI